MYTRYVIQLHNSELIVINDLFGHKFIVVECCRTLRTLAPHRNVCACVFALQYCMHCVHGHECLCVGKCICACVRACYCGPLSNCTFC